jgi:hypothetical protein
MAMVSLILAYGRDGSPPLGARTDDHEPGKSGFYYCPSCEVYGRGSACWSCDGRDVQWNDAPERSALPTRIQARSTLSTWRSPSDLERWLGRDNVQAGGDNVEAGALDGPDPMR